MLSVKNYQCKDLNGQPLPGAPVYKCYNIENATAEDIKKVLPSPLTVTTWQEKNKKGRGKIEKDKSLCGHWVTPVYLNIRMGFDIESTVIGTHDYMYIWQWSVNDVIVTGRTWKSFLVFVAVLKEFYSLGVDMRKPAFTVKRKTVEGDAITRNVYTDRRVIVWDANYNFEFQFTKKLLKFRSVFAKAKRHVLTGLTEEGLEFRDCLAISGADLASLAADFTITQKAVKKDKQTGKKISCDLDYSKLRNSKTHLTPKEMGYIWADVAILSEWAGYVWDEYVLKRGYIPITKTNVLKKEVEEAYKNRFDDEEDAGIDVPSMFPQTYGIYKNMRSKYYAGGLTLANPLHVDETLTSVGSKDITSDYPFQMMTKNFPMSKPIIMKYEPAVTQEQIKNCTDPDEVINLIESLNKGNYVRDYLNPINTTDYMSKEDLLKRLKGMKCQYMVTLIFDGLQCSGVAPVLSAARCQNYTKSTEKHLSIAANKKNVIFNGKIWRAERVVIGLCDCELEEFLKLYDYDNVHVFEVCIFKKSGKLPNYLLNLIAKYYKAKKELKKAGKKDTLAYKLAKEKVNTFYGLLVAKIVEKDFLWDLSDFTVIDKDLETNNMMTENGFSYNSSWSLIRRNSVLLPQWGIYVCGWARATLLNAIAALGEDFLYCDTDSVYYLNPKKHEAYFEARNRAIRLKNAAELPEQLNDLGEWDDQCKDYRDKIFTRFKMLGAKRYIYEYEEKDDSGEWVFKRSQTIAGLGKYDLIDYCKAKRKDIFTHFTEGFELETMFVTKKTSFYNESETSEVVIDEEGNAETMRELSSVALVNATFKTVAQKRLADLIEQSKAQLEGKTEIMSFS